jgi:C1A family cysteine protease
MPPPSKIITNPIKGRGLGKIWGPRDPRNYGLKHPKVIDYFTSTGIIYGAEHPATLPTTVDNRNYCSPIKNQYTLGACVSFSTTGVAEYFENLSYQTYISASELFVYYNIDANSPKSKNCDGGSTCQDGMKELKNTGVPPETCYPYQIGCPFPSVPAACNTEAAGYKSAAYTDLFQGTTNLQQVITNIKSTVAAFHPVIYGFYVYDQPYTDTNTNGGQWYVPCPNDVLAGGHANVIVGYDDSMVISNPHCSISSTGAFISRNSWGTGWGVNGYGFVPYDYFTNQAPGYPGYYLADEAFTITGITMPCSNPSCSFTVQ